MNDLDRLRRIGWNATADVLAADPALTVARARLLLAMPVFPHSPVDVRALRALRRIAKGKP